MNRREMVGKTESGEVIYSDPSPAANKHLAVWGKPGSGKTTYILLRIILLVKMGFSVIVLNWRKSLDHSLMNREIRKEYEQYVKVIDVAYDGIKIPLFHPMVDNNGKMETDENVCRRISSILKVAAKLTPAQENEVRAAVGVIQEEGLFPIEGIAAISNYLEVVKRKTALNAANKMRPLCDNNIVKDGDFWEDKPTIYEFDLNGLEYDDQLIVVRFILDYLGRMASRGLFIEKGLGIFVDECHNLDFSNGSTLYIMINESRKLKTRLMLATPEMKTLGKNDMSVMLQCGECVFFEQELNKRKFFAQLISAKETDKWLFKLTKLQRGQFILAGNYVKKYDDTICNDPVVLRMNLDDCKYVEDTEKIEEESI